VDNEEDDMRLWQTNPLNGITLIRGEGCTVWDATGKSYVDLLAGTWCNVLGYGHPRWAAAVRSQAGKLAHVGSAFSAAEVDEALRKLAEILPPALERAVLLNTGSEAVELALKMARACTGADTVAVVEKGYYGATSYALSLSEAGRSAPYLPEPGNVVRLPAPFCGRCSAARARPCAGFPCLDQLRAAAAAGKPAIAAIVYEPVMAVGGMIVPPPGYGRELRELADRCGCLLVSEEVTTGVGRTGRWFGFEHDGVVPDVVVIGKAIGGGLPVSAVATTGAVERRCQGVLRHVQSHQNDPFSGRIAATVISIIQDEGLVERASVEGDRLLEGLRALQSRYPAIRDVRGKGLMAGIELQEHLSGAGAELQGRLLEAGFITDYQPANATFRLFPPYVVPRAELGRFLEALEQGLHLL